MAKKEYVLGPQNKKDWEVSYSYGGSNTKSAYFKTRKQGQEFHNKLFDTAVRTHTTYRGSKPKKRTLW